MTLLLVKKRFIFQLAKYLNSEDCDANKQLVLELLTYMYLITNSKLPIRKTVVRVLVSKDSNQIEPCLIKHLEYFMNNLKHLEKIELIKASNDLCSYILSCSENFAPGLRAVSSIAGKLFSFTCEFLNRLVSYLGYDLQQFNVNQQCSCIVLGAMKCIQYKSKKTFFVISTTQLEFSYFSFRSVMWISTCKQLHWRLSNVAVVF